MSTPILPEAARLSVAQTLRTALALALGAAVSLGLSRFSYALLLPPMRLDLGWSYFTAGLMNAVNAAGYLAGALWAPICLQRWGARRALVWGSVAASALLALHAMTVSTWALACLRGATGVASAVMFVAGGVLAAGLSTAHDAALEKTQRRLSAGLILGLYYAGVGLGIVACAAVLPVVFESVGAMGAARSQATAGWQWGWLALALLGAGATVPLVLRLAHLPAGLGASAPGQPFPIQRFAFGLAAYFMFGLGYIGYMTFIVTFLREQDLAADAVVAFYALLGVGVMVSPWIWAGHLQRHRGGQTLSLLSALLAVATLLPVLVSQAVGAFFSGALFGAVFLSVVASTTALVRHNLPAAQWTAGISAFTLVFALGQILGPGLVGLLADVSGGLHAGLAASAVILLVGALLARRQHSLGDLHP
jgi:predicted MFS family arabinose efflux permease